MLKLITLIWGQPKGTPSDIYVGTRDIAEQLNSQAVNGKVVSLDNMIDKVAMKEKLSVALRELGAL
ncbi:hypothetical protein PROPEN_01785 [Proteus penneri ATCC 35198]|nr:hypothetical protein PROPEN_01785 [Proteus penneri ATCC 35198]